MKSIIFYECSSLESITIPAGVTGIADYAFLGCNSLESVDASQCLNIQEIGGEAFLYCPIKEFLLGTSNPPVFTSGESIFDNLSDAVLKVPAENFVFTYAYICPKGVKQGNSNQELLERDNPSRKSERIFGRDFIQVQVI